MRYVSMFAFMAAVSLSLVWSDNASAQKGTKKTAEQTLVTALEAIRTTLNSANHDYKGHRAAAVHQVSHAIHVIKHGKPHPKPAETFQAPKGGNNEPQSVSDAQLQASVTALQGLTVPPSKIFLYPQDKE